MSEIDNLTKKVPGNTITRDVKYLAEPTGNLYETVVILYKRANQIAMAEKKELNKKLEDFKNDRDTMEEVFENKEQIEISKYYERQPKPDLVAISEFENGDLYYRMASHDDEEQAVKPAGIRDSRDDGE
ncbi:MAG: DNA-directed RNA polymerase subunit omega [Bacteroidales bacterium]|jgi:DNA-directed RNA polymerase subunit K/omega|nr:DNA-directed RNA polymerase subunit omega [Bacteroidales bacterium]MCI1785373.1 DNA-directed RNA polymerase subunit omega [Bacteroidales bacterium]